MQEHIYTAKTSKIIGQSVYIWLFVLLQVFMNIHLAGTLISRGEYGALLLLNLLLGVINVPAIIIFLKYYRHSVGKEFIISFDTLRYNNTNTGQCAEINNSDIDEIILVQNKRMSRLPWVFHEYFVLKDGQGKEIIVTSYMMEIQELWLDTLTRRIDSKKLIKEEKYYPIF